jgi:hypothetical protein
MGDVPPANPGLRRFSIMARVIWLVVVSVLVISSGSPVCAQYGYDPYSYGSNYYAPYSQRPDTIDVDQYYHYQYRPDRVGMPTYQQYYNAGQGVYGSNQSSQAQSPAATQNAANYPYNANTYGGANSTPYGNAYGNGYGNSAGQNATAPSWGSAVPQGWQGQGYQNQAWGNPNGNPALNSGVPYNSNPYLTGAGASGQGAYNQRHSTPGSRGAVRFSPFMTGRPDTISVDQFHHYQYTPGRVGSNPRLRYYNAAPPGKIAK